MRRIVSMLLILALTVLSWACAEGALNAYDLALMLAEYMPDMVDIKEMPLEYGEQNRVIWYDARLDVKCALIVYEDPGYAAEASLMDSTRTTAVRNVDVCALYIHRDLGADIILDYQLALAEILGVRIDQSTPDYILNESTRKFHYPDCETLPDMKESNGNSYSGDPETLIRYGYESCKICNP